MENGRASQPDTLRQWHLSGSGKDVLTQERLHIHLGDLDRKQEKLCLPTVHKHRASRAYCTIIKEEKEEKFKKEKRWFLEGRGK